MTEEDPPLTNVRDLTPRLPPVRRADALWQDPNLTGELLLLALALDHLIDTHVRVVLAADIERLTGLRPATYRYLIRDDIPHYEPPPYPHRCMYVGPRGGVCRRGSLLIKSVPDLDDGTVTYIVGCHQHRAWAEQQLRAIAATRGVRVPPKPAYNTRSKLAPHFPEVNWPVLWVKWTESRQWGEMYDINRDILHGGDSVPQRPKLQLIADPPPEPGIATTNLEGW